MIKQLRLSSQNVMSRIDYITVNLWRDRVKVWMFSYCVTGCKHADEHDYIFDGQIFYKKREQ